MKQDKEKRQKRTTNSVVPSIAKLSIKRDKYKVVIFNIINVILIAIVIYLINTLPKVATRVKELRAQEIANKEAVVVGVLKANVEENIEKVEQIRSLLIDQQQYFDFVFRLQDLQATTVLSSIGIPQGNPVNDASGKPGLTFSLTYQGTIDEINQVINQIYSLPYLMKAQTADLTLINQQEQRYQLTQTIFIYVDENFGRN